MIDPRAQLEQSLSVPGISCSRAHWAVAIASLQKRAISSSLPVGKLCFEVQLHANFGAKIKQLESFGVLNVLISYEEVWGE